MQLATYPQYAEGDTLLRTTRRRVWLDALAERLGDRARAPVDHLQTDWSAEEWSAGGMIAHFAPGVLTSYGPTLRAPVGRVHWAGAERATLMHGLMEGATGRESTPPKRCWRP